MRKDNEEVAAGGRHSSEMTRYSATAAAKLGQRGGWRGAAPPRRSIVKSNVNVSSHYIPL